MEDKKVIEYNIPLDGYIEKIENIIKNMPLELLQQALEKTKKENGDTEVLEKAIVSKLRKNKKIENKSFFGSLFSSKNKKQEKDNTLMNWEKEELDKGNYESYNFEEEELEEDDFYYDDED